LQVSNIEGVVFLSLCCLRQPDELDEPPSPPPLLLLLHLPSRPQQLNLAVKETCFKHVDPCLFYIIICVDLIGWHVNNDCSTCVQNVLVHIVLVHDG